MAQIHNMIHALSRLHVEDCRDIIAIDYMLLYFYTVDERKDAGKEAHYFLPACQFRHQWALKRYVGCEGHRRKVFARETVQITLYYRNAFRSRHRLSLIRFYSGNATSCCTPITRADCQETNRMPHGRYADEGQASK